LTRAVDDPAERVATVLRAKRELLLRAHWRRLDREDLEDCLGQVALELVTRARANPFDDDRHIANALEQKFLSRVTDRQRALAGRSAMVAATRDAVRLDANDTDDIGLAHGGTDISEAAANRDELRRIREVAAELSDDQRLVLACQVSLGMGSAEFCERYGWSREKFKKVAQRARARLSKLMTEYELGERCRRLEADLLAYAANVATGAQVATVRAHLVNCAGCAAYVRGLRLASGRVATALPVPALAAHAGMFKLAVAAKLHGWWQSLTAPFGRTGASAAGSVGAGGLAKAGVATFCAAGLVIGGHSVVATPSRENQASTKSASIAPRQRARATASSVTVSDVLRPAHVSVASAPSPGRRTPRRPTGRHRRKPQVRTAAASLTRPDPTPPPTPASPAPSTPRARSVAPRHPPPSVPGDTSAEFGVE
jgi:DNA-directed RNA polymerase specialized sigma24 family protein